MLLNNLKQTLRLLFKEKRITLINIIGLSVSLACALFMLLWVEHEMSYDRFHKDFKQLYRVEEDQYYSGEEPYHVNVTPYVSGPVWKDEVPEIIEQCRLSTGGQLFTYGENKYFEDGIVLLIPPSLICSPMNSNTEQENVLRDPYSPWYHRGDCTKYFGDENPVGKPSGKPGKPVHDFGCIGKAPENTVMGLTYCFPGVLFNPTACIRNHGGPIPSRPL